MMRVLRMKWKNRDSLTEKTKFDIEDFVAADELGPLSEILSSPDKIKRILLTLGLSTCLIIFAVQLVQLISLYRSDPISTIYSVADDYDPQLASFALCPGNWVNIKKAAELGFNESLLEMALAYRYIWRVSRGPDEGLTQGPGDPWILAWIPSLKKALQDKNMTLSDFFYEISYCARLIEQFGENPIPTPRHQNVHDVGVDTLWFAEPAHYQKYSEELRPLIEKDNFSLFGPCCRVNANNRRLYEKFSGGRKISMEIILEQEPSEYPNRTEHSNFAEVHREMMKRTVIIPYSLDRIPVFDDDYISIDDKYMSYTRVAQVNYNIEWTKFIYVNRRARPCQKVADGKRYPRNHAQQTCRLLCQDKFKNQILLNCSEYGTHDPYIGYPPCFEPWTHMQWSGGMAAPLSRHEALLNLSSNYTDCYESCKQVPRYCEEWEAKISDLTVGGRFTGGAVHAMDYGFEINLSSLRVIQETLTISWDSFASDLGGLLGLWTGFYIYSIFPVLAVIVGIFTGTRYMERKRMMKSLHRELTNVRHIEEAVFMNNARLKAAQPCKEEIVEIESVDIRL